MHEIRCFDQRRTESPLYRQISMLHVINKIHLERQHAWKIDARSLVIGVATIFHLENLFPQIHTQRILIYSNIIRMLFEMYQYDYDTRVYNYSANEILCIQYIGTKVFYG